MQHEKHAEDISIPYTRSKRAGPCPPPQVANFTIYQVERSFNIQLNFLCTSSIDSYPTKKNLSDIFLGRGFVK